LIRISQCLRCFFEQASPRAGTPVAMKVHAFFVMRAIGQLPA
jgi:hypothetical protein